MNKIMNKNHSRWKEFLYRLEGSEGCNFQGNFDDEGELITESVTWECSGGNNKDFAIAILFDMGNIDIEKSLKYFEDNGGYCDCEILFNVADV